MNNRPADDDPENNPAEQDKEAEQKILSPFFTLSQSDIEAKQAGARDDAVQNILSEAKRYIDLKLNKGNPPETIGEKQHIATVFSQILEITTKTKKLKDAQSEIASVALNNDLIGSRLDDHDTWKVLFLTRIYSKAKEYHDNRDPSKDEQLYKELQNCIGQAKIDLEENGNNYSSVFTTPVEYPRVVNTLVQMAPSQHHFFLMDEKGQENEMSSRNSPATQKKSKESIQAKLYYLVHGLMYHKDPQYRNRYAEKLPDLFAQIQQFRELFDGENTFESDLQVKKIHQALSEEAVKSLRSITAPNMTPEMREQALLTAEHIIKSLLTCQLSIDNIIKQGMKNQEGAFQIKQAAALYRMAEKYRTDKNDDRFFIKVMKEAGTREMYKEFKRLHLSPEREALARAILATPGVEEFSDDTLLDLTRDFSAEEAKLLLSAIIYGEPRKSELINEKVDSFRLTIQRFGAVIALCQELSQDLQSLERTRFELTQDDENYDRAFQRSKSAVTNLLPASIATSRLGVDEESLRQLFSDIETVSDLLIRVDNFCETRRHECGGFEETNLEQEIANVEGRAHDVGALRRAAVAPLKELKNAIKHKYQLSDTLKNMVTILDRMGGNSDKALYEIAMKMKNNAEIAAQFCNNTPFCHRFALQFLTVMDAKEEEHVMEHYVGLAAEKPAELYDLFMNTLDHDKQKKMGLLLLSNQRMRQWLLEPDDLWKEQQRQAQEKHAQRLRDKGKEVGELKIENPFDLVTTTSLRVSLAEGMTLEALDNLFKNWSKKECLTLIRRGDSPQVCWAVLTQTRIVSTMSADEFNFCMGKLDLAALSQLTNRQISQLDKKVRIALLNKYASWEEGKVMLLSGCESPDKRVQDEAIKNRIVALSHDFNLNDIDTLQNSETGLMACFKNDAACIEKIIALINEDVNNPHKRKIGRNIINEMDVGFLASDQELWNTINASGFALPGAAGKYRSYRHQMMTSYLYEYKEEDGYPLDLRPDGLVRKEIDVNPADLALNASRDAFKAVLKDPAIVQHLNEKSSARAAPFRVGRMLYALVIEGQGVGEQADKVNCLHLSLKTAAEKNLTARELQDILDAHRDNQNTEKLLFNALPTYVEYAKPERAIGEIFALIKRYLEKNPGPESRKKIMNALLANTNMTDGHKYKILGKLCTEDMELFNQYLADFSDDGTLPGVFTMIPLTAYIGTTLALSFLVGAVVVGLLFVPVVGPFLSLLAAKVLAPAIAGIALGATLVAKSIAERPILSGAVGVAGAAVVAVGVAAKNYLYEQKRKKAEAHFELIKSVLNSDDKLEAGGKSIFAKLYEFDNQEVAPDGKSLAERLTKSLLLCQAYGCKIGGKYKGEDGKKHYHIADPKLRKQVVALTNDAYYKEHPNWAFFTNIITLGWPYRQGNIAKQLRRELEVMGGDRVGELLAPGEAKGKAGGSDKGVQAKLRAGGKQVGNDNVPTVDLGKPRKSPMFPLPPEGGSQAANNLANKAGKQAANDPKTLGKKAQ